MKETKLNQNITEFGNTARDVLLDRKIDAEIARAKAAEAAVSTTAIRLLGNEAVSGEPYHFPYHLALNQTAESIGLNAYTITLDNERTLTQYPFAIPAATDSLAGIVTAADHIQIYKNSNIENGSGTGSAQMKSDGGITTFDFTGKNQNATDLDQTLTGDINYGATGNYATTLGGKNAAQGKRSLAEGSTTIAKGDYSHAEGTNSVALGISSHAEGQTTTAYGAGSHAEGNNTLALGPFSHAEGRNTITYTEEAHAGGLDSIAARPYTFAHGNYVVAENIAEAVFGQFNDFAGSESYDNGRLFVVGNGDSHASRSNAFEVYKDGHAAVGKAIGTETDLTVATKGYVDQHSFSLTSIQGYDPTKHQRLEHINGTFQWVDVA